jgi:hypothetical protein
VTVTAQSSTQIRGKGLAPQSRIQSLKMTLEFIKYPQSYEIVNNNLFLELKYLKWQFKKDYNNIKEKICQNL